jgi:hypothetical protein
MPVILALGRLGQEDHQFEAILSHIASSRQAWGLHSDMVRPCLKKKKKERKGKEKKKKSTKPTKGM